MLSAFVRVLSGLRVSGFVHLCPGLRPVVQVYGLGLAGNRALSCASDVPSGFVRLSAISASGFVHLCPSFAEKEKVTKKKESNSLYPYLRRFFPHCLEGLELIFISWAAAQTRFRLLP